MLSPSSRHLEMMNATVSAAQLREKKPLHPDMPVMVLTAGIPSLFISLTPS
ncbi:hypothetical protein QJQ58_06410 [Paenibacillus dendritiformis]|uniref:hypothetical protein n=1 Tax=Paenibacillus TaxID=44249 RepID=UPI001409E5C8|nr:hypothetical protein [Paenibacillus dendritiformis]WGU95892.1 hypothetical protein QJQ58_06410 [Paenibacillus dendritiformis]